MERERILSQQRDIHDFLEMKADHAFQGEFAAQTRLTEAQAELDGREWERRHADLALYETGRQLESQRMELYEANQLSDQAQREKSWLCEESDLRNRACHEDRARNCQEIEEIRRIWCAEADRVRHLKYSELSTTERETLYRKSAFGSDSGTTGQGEFLE